MQNKKTCVQRLKSQFSYSTMINKPRRAVFLNRLKCGLFCKSLE